MKAKILEIFRSIQGEGLYAGVDQVFVRLFECNMHCSWCDTPASIGDTSRNFNEMELDELENKIYAKADGVHSVSLTGGEPLVQSFMLSVLMPRLKKAGFLTYLETNGTLSQGLKEVLAFTDIISMDMKLPSSTGCQAYWDEHVEFLEIAQEKEVFVKIVVTSETRSEEIIQAAKLIARVRADIPLILQPNTYQINNGAVPRCVDLMKECGGILQDTRLLPQMHKFMRIP